MSKLHPLTKWVIEKIEADYKDDIALLIGIKGHSTDNDEHGECFDYFIPMQRKVAENIRMTTNVSCFVKVVLLSYEASKKA